VSGPSSCDCSDRCSQIVAPERLVCPDCVRVTVWLPDFPPGMVPGWLCLGCRVAYFCIPGSSGGVLGVSGLFDDDESFLDFLNDHFHDITDRIYFGE